MQKPEKTFVMLKKWDNQLLERAPDKSPKEFIFTIKSK